MRSLQASSFLYIFFVLTLIWPYKSSPPIYQILRNKHLRRRSRCRTPAVSVAPLNNRGMEVEAGGAAGVHARSRSSEAAEPPKPLVDDDGRPRRTGTLWTAIAHIITAVIGSGVLSLAWGVAQLGWAAGPAVMVLFAAVICYTSTLLAECYRSGDPVFGPRNRSYIDAVRATLGESKERLCCAIQLSNLFGIGIGVSIAASVSMQYVALH